MEIKVEHVEGPYPWRVTYALAAPARALGFLRPAGGLRHAWRLVDPGFAFRPPANPTAGDTLARTDGAPFATVTLEVATARDKPPKDYPPFCPLTDGSTAVYTGYYDAVPLACGETMECSFPSALPPVPFTFVAAKGEQVVTPGSDPGAVLRWSGTEDGTFAYFGTIAPLSTRDLTAIVDPGMPSWLHAKMSDLLPRVFAYYAEKTQQHLPTRPLIVMSYGDDSNADGYSWDGSALPLMIEFDARLGEHHRSPDDPWLKAFVPYVVAHEAAHLWNNGLFVNAADGRGGTWLHEGGADAFAYRALRDLGIETRAEYHGQLSDALSNCVLGLGLLGEPLTKSSNPAYFMNYYFCGSTIALWSEALTASAPAAGDLFALWRDVFSVSTEAHYDDAIYYGRVEERSSAASAVRTFVETRIEDPRKWIVDALTKAGVQIREDDAAAPKSFFYSSFAGRHAARLLLSADGCTRARSTRTGDAPCRTLPKNATLEAIGGHNVLHDGVGAYDALAAGCTKKGGMVSVKLQGEVSARSVPCGDAMPRRPRYLRVVRAPFD